MLAGRCDKLSVLELDDGYCRRLQDQLGDQVAVMQGDATRMPFEDQRFSAVVCFTMLHHIPSRELQDRALSEAARVLRPGGVFAGSDTIGRPGHLSAARCEAVSSAARVEPPPPAASGCRAATPHRE